MTFEFIPWSSILCVTQISFYVRYLIMGLIPIMALLVLITFLTILHAKARFNMDDNNYKTKGITYKTISFFEIILVYSLITVSIDQQPSL